MSGGIFLIQSDDQLVEMTEQRYDSEDRLQELLARYPNLLAGQQIDAAAPRRWLLVAREMGVADDEDAADRWSLDHLFLDQDGVPTLVEVKRSTDSRIRREVVGQMLDYAANALSYWNVDKVQAEYEALCEREGVDAKTRLAEFLSEEQEADLDGYWAKVDTNLHAGKVRMIFVADVIPPELQRIVEFLNRQMDPAQVLAVEIKQFVGQNMRTMVPRVIGHLTDQPKPPIGTKQWDEASFMEDLAKRQGSDGARVAKSILEWAERRTTRIWWGRGLKDGSCVPVLDRNNRAYQFLNVRTYGRLEVQFQYLKGTPPFADESKRLELLNRLNRIAGVQLPNDAIMRRPSIPLRMFSNPDALKALLDAFEWVVDQIKTA